jgi:dTDP-4-dehydrorhamnose reductase
MKETCSHRPLELWGGIECTVNRVGDVFYDQIKRSGHETRISDLDRFAALGISSIRYPVLWERVAPESLDRQEWQWSDERLQRLRTLGIRPIIGLVHHGSGPRYTDLLDPDFPTKLASYARIVAERYPWVDAYTPVNEPLTTSRFSGLYGHWYPHHRNDRSFVRMLFNQLKGTVLAMREIRQVNRDAQLIQTDDLGKVFSTPRLRYQADFENERRWLTYDLLCGRAQLSDPIRDHLRRIGEEHLFAWFGDNPVPPEICGFNYYLTSERLLDERLHLYPGLIPGGNHQDSYIDVEAVRVRAHGLEGAHTLLAEAWSRLQLPIAVTEVHNGCTREEQLRWILEIWKDCQQLREENVDVRAVTSWSLLGAFDWNSLVTRHTDFYEPGAFDVRGREPRPTAIAKLLPHLAKSEHPHHPVFATRGWWHHEDRFTHGHAYDLGSQRHRMHLVRRHAEPQPLLITGRTGTLGQAFGKVCEQRGLPYELTSRQELSITDPASISFVMERLQPWAVINTAGYVRVDDAEADQKRCFEENTLGPTLLAEACGRHGIPFVSFSTDLVFGGNRSEPWMETDPTSPLSIYGRSKALAEQSMLAIARNALVVRTSAFFGPWDEYNFVTLLLAALVRGETFPAIADCIISPTYVPDLVNATLDLLIDEEHGIVHLANEGAMSWYEFGCKAAAAAGLDESSIVPISIAEASLVAPRPPYSALTSKLRIMPSLEDALERYLLARPVTASGRAACSNAEEELAA